MKRKVVTALMLAMLTVCSGTVVNAGQIGSNTGFPEGVYLLKKGDEWLYLVDGEQDKTKIGFVDFNGGKFLVANGRVVTEKSGLVNDPDNSADWYFLANGQVQLNHTGLTEYDGAWFFVEEGKLDTNLNEFVYYDGGKFLIAAGQLKSEVSGLVQDPKYPEDWYFLANGQVQTEYSGLASYDGAWFYVESGNFMNGYIGYVEHNGSMFYIQNGQMICGAEEIPLYVKAKENCSVYAGEMEKVKDFVNQYRAEVGVSGVVLDEALCMAASVRAQEMADNDYFSHSRPNGDSCFTVLEEFGIERGTAGENIALGYRDAAAVSNGWYNSSGHYRNMVNESFQKLGVGVARNEAGRLYWVQLFTD